MPYSVAKAMGRLGPAVALAVMLGAAAAAPPKVYESPARIQAMAPGTKVTPLGVVVEAKNGYRLEFRDNPFQGKPPSLCWYVPALNVVGVCQYGPGVTMTTLVNLQTGRKVAAPGRAALGPSPGLIVIGPGGAHHDLSDSLTLVRASAGDLVEEGGAQFDDAHGPGRWVDATCYRMAAKGDWLEKTPEGWKQAAPGDSKICTARHGG